MKVYEVTLKEGTREYRRSVLASSWRRALDVAATAYVRDNPELATGIVAATVSQDGCLLGRARVVYSQVSAEMQ